MRIDLHAHTRVSDGTDSPAELVAKAAAARLDVLALTDHDSTGGWDEAIAALPTGLTLVPGAEFSCRGAVPGGSISLHLLGYLFDRQAPAVVAEQERLRAQRRSRLQEMATRMAADFPIDVEEILAGVPADGSAGRPHLAAALVRIGAAESVADAFDRYLSSGGPYFVRGPHTKAPDAVRMIVEAGGVAVLAHPFGNRRGTRVTPELIATLAGEGLRGVEVFHPEHDERSRAELRSLATDLGLLTTGGSDYHGTNKTVALGGHLTPAEVYEELFAGATGGKVISA
ncbi:PHP domain-containing protein [Pseudonocardiaceae bacterium YIM PH 21723]|nr:PHP domain-containing protein [Pseudonocardiaceae bacterium YIM PH 21723]